MSESYRDLPEELRSDLEELLRAGPGEDFDIPGLTDGSLWDASASRQTTTHRGAEREDRRGDAQRQADGSAVSRIIARARTSAQSPRGRGGL